LTVFSKFFKFFEKIMTYAWIFMHMSLKRRGLPVNLSCSRPWPLFWPEVGNDTHFWPVFGVKVGSASGLLVDVVVDNDLGLLVDVGNGTQIGLFFGAKVGDVLLSL
jgi:hypothetical protein